MRGRRDTLICNNCRRDKQKCIRDPEDDGSQVCHRCEKYNYTNCSTDPAVKPVERKRRILNDLKCEKCRKDHKTCTFTYAPWPSPCDRCARTSSQCSPPTRPSRARGSKGSIPSDGSDCQSTIAPSEYTADYSEYNEYHDYGDFDYVTGFEGAEDDSYGWGHEAGSQWQGGYQHPAYHMDYNDPFSPDSTGSSDVSSIAGYSEGPTSPFAYRR
ncbi:hypothetical protein ABW19_dt0205577 [Dactylella cylindrospora]|nr:hypothetical protein ABW19_dt0205577 [Dactylella cylindrospora]